MGNGGDYEPLFTLDEAFDYLNELGVLTCETTTT